MPHWAACFRHRGEKNKRNPNSVYTNHRTLGKLNARNSGSNEFEKSASVAISSHEASLFNRQNFVSIVSQQYFGRPTRLCPTGCQANISLIQRCPGNVAKYCATFQWCRKQSFDHDLDAACIVNTRTRSFTLPWQCPIHVAKGAEKKKKNIMMAGKRNLHGPRSFTPSILLSLGPNFPSASSQS